MSGIKGINTRVSNSDHNEESTINCSKFKLDKIQGDTFLDKVYLKMSDPVLEHEMVSWNSGKDC